jgi:hypothetical protein
MNGLVHNPSLIKLIWYYFYNGGGFERIETSFTMRKYREAYIEAAHHLINLEYFTKKFSNE